MTEEEVVLKISQRKDIQPRITYDSEKVRYNAYYQSIDFWKKKFPKRLHDY